MHDDTADRDPTGERATPTPTGDGATPEVGVPAVDPRFDVPDGASPAVCDRCGRPFPAERVLALHRAYDHPDGLTDAEREAAEAAYAAESDELRRFRLLALAGVVALYFGFLFAYAVFG